jgi:hypothetical protein
MAAVTATEEGEALLVTEEAEAVVTSALDVQELIFKH